MVRKGVKTSMGSPYLRIPSRMKRCVFHSRICCFLLCFPLVILFLSVTALPAFASYVEGEVLYRQDFTKVSTASLAEVRAGSANSTDAFIGVTVDGLLIDPCGDWRTYAVLPEIPCTENYTVTFSFRFGESYTTNAYFAFLLTCTGEKPSNVTAVIFRIDGSVDDFGNLTDSIVQNYKNGETVHVTIPIADAVLHTVTVSCGDETQTLERTSLLRIPEGNRGFCVRNASVLVEETAIMYGTEYDTPTGYYAVHSYAEDNGARTDLPLFSPETNDSLRYAAYFAPIGFLVFAQCAKQRLKSVRLRR